MMVTTVYDEIAVPAVRYGPCPGCGKRVKRQRTFTQTVNPWNTIEEDGHKRPKTPSEVWKATHAQAIAWNPDPEVFRHGRCAGG